MGTSIASSCNCAHTRKHVYCLFTPLCISGFTVFYNARSGAAPPSIPILLQQLSCTGSEARLIDCRHSGIGVVSSLCGHSDDAGVRCLTGESRHFGCGWWRFCLLLLHWEQMLGHTWWCYHHSDHCGTASCIPYSALQMQHCYGVMSVLLPFLYYIM